MPETDMAEVLPLHSASATALALALTNAASLHCLRHQNPHHGRGRSHRDRIHNHPDRARSHHDRARSRRQMATTMDDDAAITLVAAANVESYIIIPLDLQADRDDGGGDRSIRTVHSL